MKKKKTKVKIKKKEVYMYFGKEQDYPLTDRQIMKMKEAELLRDWQDEQWGW